MNTEPYRLKSLFSFERLTLKTISLNPNGPIAQLGERLLCTQEVSGSIPLVSILSERIETRPLKTEYYITNLNQKFTES